jgi:hypothetical protein
MTAVTRESPTQFQVRFAALARGALGRRPAIVQVDPYLVGRAIAEVMRACTVRAANGRRLLWNDYRMILAAADLEPLRALAGPLERDLAEVLTCAVEHQDAERCGPVRVRLVADESHELEGGCAIVRVAFVPRERLEPARAGEMTVGIDAWTAGTRVVAEGERTVHVAEVPGAAPRRGRLTWPGGEALLPPGTTVVVGRPHPEPPAAFVALTGASLRVSKQHAWIRIEPAGVRIGRCTGANPLAVGGARVAAGAAVAVTELPVALALSHGDLTLTLRWA